jgi:hypothetical protein
MRRREDPRFIGGHGQYVDALAHLGVRPLDMPVNGENIWRAIEAAGREV